MAINRPNVLEALQSLEFKKLFIAELGWDRVQIQPLDLTVEGRRYRLEAIAEKRGMVAFLYDSDTDNNEPPHYSVRRKIENEVRKYAHEHIIVYLDRPAKLQVWQWVRREPGKPAACREHVFQLDRPGDSLLQKLDDISFSLAEEEDLSITVVAGRAKRAFDVDHVTKQFYDRFKTEHDVLLNFIEGITSKGDREWYASLMLNRLMFTYFIQKKGFLDGDRDYLKNRLAMMKKREGNDRFHSFYRYFLIRLFHEGLGQVDHRPELDELLGRVPYLNGGLFDVHSLERENLQIEIADEAFERVFEFFDSYQWHLDERPLRDDNEINPDVLGYIFEKYINQKQMGAYYTKEDITEYISRNTVVPSLLATAREDCRIAFDNPGGPTVWHLLSADPDRYIHSSLKLGVQNDLPAVVSRSASSDATESTRSLLDRRRQWNQTAQVDWALPMESWRDVAARRSRYQEVFGALQRGDVSTVEDLITFNLDLCQFAQDIIEASEGPELIRSMWNAVEKITILDPTCGSGAFLFAALNILEPLYEACLQRMESAVSDLDRERSNDKAGLDDFRLTLARVATHPNRRYFIFKSIILNNLYGVDIMEEAVEICKLRLFLKLAAQVEPEPRSQNFGIEPLPDIDFNIRAGNTLVGYVTLEGARREISSKLDFDDAMGQISTKAAALQGVFDSFRLGQVNSDEATQPERKSELKERLAGLQDELNRYLASDYGVKLEKHKDYSSWLERHQPFHWCVEFYGIMRDEGFDVVIGNPPYVEYAKVKMQYQVKGFKTIESSNLFAFCTERSLDLSSSGRIGLIVPVSAVCTDRTESLQSILFASPRLWASSFDVFPGRLFEGAAQRLSILIVDQQSVVDARPSSQIFTTGYRRWFAQERDHLMDSLSYARVSEFVQPTWTPRLGPDDGTAVLRKLLGAPLGTYFLSSKRNPLYVHRIVNNFIKAVDFAPRFQRFNEPVGVSPDFKLLGIDEAYREVVLAVLNSNLFYWYWRCHGDGFHCGLKDIAKFPLGLDRITPSIEARLSVLGQRMSSSLAEHSEMRERNQKKTGRVELQTFFVSKSKPIADEIDLVLGEHFGLTPEELDYVINYDIKYRMGTESDEDVIPVEG